jgi:hypothetical protein
MSRSLHVSSLDKAPAKSASQPVMVYVCECGAKWTTAAKPAWECKCGRRLVMRNGIIHTALYETAGKAASRARSVRMATVH